MPVVYPKDVAFALGLSKIGFLGRLIARIVMWFLRLHKINTIYDRCVANSDEATLPPHFCIILEPTIT